MVDHPTEQGSKRKNRSEQGDTAPNEPDEIRKKQKLGPSVSFADVLADMGKEEVKAGNGTENGINSWARPVVNLTDDEIPIIFQNLDIKELALNGISTIQLFGSTEEGLSVLANVTGFMHYLYYPIPVGFTPDDLERLIQHLNGYFTNPIIRRIEIVQRRLTKSGNGISFLKISISDPQKLRELRGIFEKGRCQYNNLFNSPEKVYEGTVDYILRFMLDTEIAGMIWIKVPAKKYTLVTEKVSHCQIEFNVRHDDLEPLPTEGKWSKIAPLRILSFDIEAQPRGEEFPQPGRDSVLQIANMVTHLGEKKPFIRNVFTLDSCLPIEGSQVLSYLSESEMLTAWRDFLIKVDPDVITGYNIARFDIPYLLIRARNLQLNKFPSLGRLHDSPTSIARMPLQWPDVPTLPGRLSLDVLHYVSKNYKFSPPAGAYKLGAVSARFLDQNKEDIHFSMITELQSGTSESRRRLAIYCAKDAYLPQLLMDKLECLEKRAQIARSEFVPMNSLLNKEGLVARSRALRNAIGDGCVLRL